MAYVKISPDVLRWARRRAGLSEEQLAKRVGKAKTPEIVRAWETGEAQPTFRQAQKLARALQIPLGYLFLSTPPTTTLPIVDFRSLPSTERGKFSPDLEDVLNDALRKRDWMREWRIREGFDPVPFIGRFTQEDAPERIAADIRETLALPTPPVQEVRSWAEYLRLLVRRAENAGIMVLQSGIVGSNTRRTLSVEEFRGFALPDKYAPLIFINARDSIAGRIFTLAHELGHIWTDTGGVSNPEPILPIPPGTPAIERLCNQIAAELLVPVHELRRQWTREQDILDTVQEMAKIFRVSVFVILIRAYELGLVSYESFQTVYAQAQEKVKEIAPPGRRGRGNFYHNLQARNGLLLLQEIGIALRQEALLYQEAARLLNVQPQTLENALQQIGL